jgi:hypothetical protein
MEREQLLWQGKAISSGQEGGHFRHVPRTSIALRSICNLAHGPGSGLPKSALFKPGHAAA